MDTSRITAALTTAKAVISSHGGVAWMDAHNRGLLARPVGPGVRGLRYEFRGDPGSPSCFLSVGYETVEPRFPGQGGSTLCRTVLRVTLGTSAGEMDLAAALRREAVVASLAGLGEVLEALLPREVVLVLETSEEAAARIRREGDAVLGAELAAVLPPGAFRGLRVGGRPRCLPLPSAWLTPVRGWPEPGGVAFRLPRGRGSAAYSVVVSPPGPGGEAPRLSISRTD